jgi:ABC-2 type transport system permease protein
MMDKTIALEQSGERRQRGRASRTLALVMRREWRLLGRDRTLWIVVALLAAMMAYGCWNGAAWIGFQQRTIAGALDEERERLSAMQRELALIEQGRAQPARFRDPGRPGWVGEFLGERYAVLPPLPLAALSIGQRDLYPYYFRVSTQSAHTFINEDEIENPFNLATGRFDAAFVIIYLFPLVILALGYNLLSGEKEDGTLALALAQPVRLGQIMTAKLLARALVVIALAVALSIIGAALSGDGITGAAVSRVALWTLAVALYGLFWFAAAAAVSARGRGSATNAVALAAVWLALVVIVPALLAVFVSWRHPAPSRLAFINAARDERRETAARARELLEEFFAARPELRPAVLDKNDFMSGFYAAQFDRDKRLAPLAANYEAQLQRQNDLAARLRLLSPALVMQSALNDLAGSSFDRYARFVAQVHAFHREWQEFFLPKLFKRVRLSAGDYNHFPKFEYEEEAEGPVYRRVSLGLAGLFVSALALAFAAFRLLRRYPIVN